MDFPFDFQLNIVWIILVISFIILPLILMILKRWIIVITQTVMILFISCFYTYLNLMNISIESNNIYMVGIYFTVGLYISLGVYGIIDGLYKIRKK